MALRRALHSSVAAICIASLVAPAGQAAAPKAPAPRAAPGGLEVRVAQARDFSRIEFHGAAAPAVKRDGQLLTLTFGRDSNPDISRLRVSPPRWLKGAEARHAAGRLQLLLTLAPDAEARTGAADGAFYVNVFAKPEPEAAPAAAKTDVVAENAPAAPVAVQRPNPVPASGVVHMDAKLVNGQVQLKFPWANANGAAVFRRGDAVWVVFDASATLDVAKAPRGLRQYSSIQAFRGTDYSAVRIAGAAARPVSAGIEGPVWTITLGGGGGTDARPSLIKLARDELGGPAALQAPVAGVTRVVQVADTVVGDTLSVVTALGPAKGLPSRREFVQMAFLPSAQGLVLESYVEDLSVTYDGDLVHIARPAGLALSASSAARGEAQGSLGSLQPAGMPAMIGADWGKTGSGGFLARYNALLAAASEESAGGPDSPVTARMSLARFLVGSDLAFEAIGVLNDTARSHPAITDDPEFRGLRGVSRVMARRYKEAEADFSSPVLADDPSSALWRSYISAQLAHWTDARQQFAAGVEAFSHFSPVWKARFARGDAQAAMAMGDLDGASSRIRLALDDKTDPLEELATRLVQARIVEAQGHKDRALAIYSAITRAPVEYLSAPAQLHATQIRLETGKMTPVQAAAVFDGLRYRWRGDATELETIRLLGQLYLNQGRYREALEALRSAGQRMPDLPEALQLQSDLTAAFRALFLDGYADGLEPIQALALFFDFKELTPIGAEGDLMVRKLVRRLVDVDLLDQAADLLRYQVDNRLDGVPRAQVATDLAVIYLMDRKPEEALQAINGSRTTILPAALNNERRLIEARAWAGLGRYDSALEIIERDTTKEGADLRADITWKQKNWAAAGPMFEKLLGERWKNPAPLAGEEEGKLLRAGVAYSLAGDDASLERLNKQYQGFYDGARNPEALRVALSGIPTGRLSVGDLGRATADNEAFFGWVSKMKQRFKTPNAPAAKQVAANPPAKAA